MTSSIVVDLVLLLLLAGAAVAGWRRGGLRLAGSVVGLAVGLLLGLRLVPPLAAQVTGTVHWVLTVLGVALTGALVAEVGRWLAGLVAGVLARLHLSLLDRAAGAVGGVLLGSIVLGATLTLLPTTAADTWLGQARSSSLGSTATDVAARALDVVHAQVPDSTNLPLSRGSR